MRLAGKEHYGRSKEQIEIENEGHEMTFAPNLRKKKKKQKTQKPLLFVEIDLHNVRKKVVINEGDNSDQVVKEFAQLHGLTEEQEDRLL